MTIITDDIQQAGAALLRGEVIAYPTEGVFGLGCAADNHAAVNRVLQLKQRARSKGVITLVRDLLQVAAWLDNHYAALWHKASDSWPAPITWLFPASEQAPVWLTGDHDRIALRCPDHPVAQALCRDSPVISTSANPAGQPPATTASQVVEYFDGQLDLIVAGHCGPHSKPSQIRDLISDKILR